MSDGAAGAAATTEATSAGRAGNARRDRIDSIQILRFIAAGAVVCTHLPIFNDGAWGVDIFFVISGFVIAYTSAASGEHFFAKRLIRVVPIYWLCTFAVFGVALVAPGLLKNTSADLSQLAMSLAFVPFDKHGTGHHPVLFVGWTLDYEMAFYAIYAVSMAVSRRYRVEIVSAILIAMVLLVPLLPVPAFYRDVYSDSLLLEFLMGIYIWKFWFLNRSLRQKYDLTILGFCVVCVAVSPFVVVGIRAIDFGLPSALFVLAGMILFDRVRTPRIFVRLGDASYSMYLIHVFIVIFMTEVLHLFDYGLLVSAVASIFIFVVVCAVSIAVFELIERPMTRTLRRKLLPAPARAA